MKRARLGWGQIEPHTKDRLVVLGLAFDLLGALWVAWGSLFITERSAIELGAPRWGGTPEQMLHLPAVQNILASARATRMGMLLVAIGCGIQIFAVWPRKDGA
jgi:hypothetical protein